MTRKTAFIAAAILVGAFMAMPMFARLDRLPDMANNDWGEVLFHQAAARQSVLSGAGLPFFCPYVNGGYPLACHPYDPSLSPLFPVILAFGEQTGTRILIFIIFALGLWGMWVSSSRIFGFTPLAAFVATAVYAASGWLPMRFFGGNFNECFLYAFPALLYLVHKGASSRYSLFGAGLILYTMMAHGKYDYIISIFFLLLWWASEKVFSRNLDRNERTLGLYSISFSILISCILGITRLFLLVKIVYMDGRNYDYEMFDQKLSLLGSMYHIYYSFIKIHIFKSDMPVLMGQLFYMNDSGIFRIACNYIGCGILALALCAAWSVASFKSRNKGLQVLLILTFILAVTNNFPLDIYRPISFLPIFKNIKYPAKYFNYFMLFFIALGAGGFFDVYLRPLGKKKKAAAAFVLAVFLLVPAMANNSKIIPLAFIKPAPARWSKADRFFNVDYGDLYPNILKGYGILKDWCGNIVLETKAVPAFVCRAPERQVGTIVRCPGHYARNPAYLGEARPENGYGAVADFSAGFNRLSFFADLFGPDTVLINTNPLKGWKTDQGEITEKDGLLAVRFDEPFTGLVTLTYRPPHIMPVAALNIAAVAALLAWLFWRRPRRGPKSGDESGESGQVEAAT